MTRAVEFAYRVSKEYKKSCEEFSDFTAPQKDRVAIGSENDPAILFTLPKKKPG